VTGTTPSPLEASGQAADGDFPASSPDQASSGCGPEPTWVEIRLLQDDGTPAAGARYKITLPDGTVKEGTLDEDGLAGFDALDPGSCEVEFPDLPQDAARLET
jgi:hypothetical protein